MKFIVTEEPGKNGELEKVDPAIPFAPEDILNKSMALFKNQSPKDLPPFPGTDKRDFLQRAEEMNKNTAKTYNQLLLIEYEAIDVFVLLNNLKN